MPTERQAAAASPMPTSSPAQPEKRSLLDGLKWALQTLAMPLALVALPLLYQWKAGEMTAAANAESRRREQAEQQFRLYTDLMMKREEADTAVRRGLFDKLVGSYLDPKPGDVDKRLVALELLSLNFHDSLNLSPLFWELDRQITAQPGQPRSKEFRSQLDRIARQVKSRQSSMLEVDGYRGSWDIDLAFVSPGQAPQGKTFTTPRSVAGDRVDVPSNAPPPEFTITVLQHDPVHRRLFVKVDSSAQDRSLSFWLDPYDFPLTNFSRVSRTERIAIVLHEYKWADGVGNASIVLLYFPSSRSGAKDKPYIDDLVARLAPAASAPAAVASSASAAK